MWSTVNAAIDGIDAGSANPQDRLKFIIYQRRILIDVLRQKALLLAAINPEEAQKVAKLYIEMLLPIDPLEQRIKELQRELRVAELEHMGPIPLDQIKFGEPMNESFIQALGERR